MTKIWVREDRKPTMIYVDNILFASYSKIENPEICRIPKRDYAMSSINLLCTNTADL